MSNQGACRNSERGVAGHRFGCLGAEITSGRAKRRFVFSLLLLATQTLKAASGSLCDLDFVSSDGWPHQDFARVSATAVTLSSTPVVTLTESPFISSVSLADLPSKVMMAEAGTMKVCSFPPFRPVITSFP